MRRSLLFLLLLPIGEVHSQLGSISGLPESEPRRIRAYGEPDGYHGDLRTGLGFATIDGGNYLSLNFQPNLQMGKLRAAFDLEFYFGGDGSFKLRDDMYDDGAGWLRSIRHIYWGSEADTLHAGVGTLYDVTYGSGMLVSHYNNASNWDQRKFGFLIDFNFPAFTIETFSSNLLDQQLLAGRIAAIPFYRYNAPFVNTLELGVTAMRDTDTASSKASTLSGMGLDVGFYPIKTNGFQWKVFAEHASYEDYGHAHGFGTIFHMPDLWNDVLDLEILYSLRLVDDQFIPGYVNPAYELNRARHGLIDLLETAPDGMSHFTQIYSTIFDHLNLRANYSSPADNEPLGMFTAEASLPQLLDPVELSLSYSKTHMDGFGDFTDVDENSVVRAIADWRMTSLLYLSVLYRAHWIEKTSVDANQQTVKTFEKQDTFRPQLVLRYQW